MKNQIWLIGIANTAADGATVYRVSGTKAQVRSYLANLVKEVKEDDRESFDYGSTSVKGVYETRDGYLNAYATFSDYHIDFTAVPEAAPIPLTKKGKKIKVSGITLLTEEEAEKLPEKLKVLGTGWWLRSPGYYCDTAAIMGSAGAHGIYNVYYSDYGVRPALNLESSDLKIGDKIEMAGYKWTAIAGDKVLCDTIVGKTCFRKNANAPDANEYETSDIKAWLEKWAKDKGMM